MIQVHMMHRIQADKYAKGGLLLLQYPSYSVILPVETHLQHILQYN